MYSGKISICRVHLRG